MWWLTSLAFAQDAISVSLIKHGQVETSYPTVIINVRQPLEELSIKVTCGSTIASLSKSVSRGEVKLPITIPKGTHNCTGTISISMDDGSSGEMPLSFKATQYDALKMFIPEDMVELEQATLQVKMDRAAHAYQIELYDSDNRQVGTGYVEVSPSHNLGLTKVNWEAMSKDIAVLRITGTDIYGFTTQTDLFPWHYDIPHEDVVFASNESVIPTDQLYKLTAVQSEVNEVVRRYSQFAVVNLYVAGYTDTVGDASANLKLSEARAKSIATWFQTNNFSGNIYYQGFGESVLAVTTGDGVDEPQNRRALYVVAASDPKSDAFPSKRWIQLQ